DPEGLQRLVPTPSGELGRERIETLADLRDLDTGSAVAGDAHLLIVDETRPQPLGVVQPRDLDLPLQALGGAVDRAGLRRLEDPGDQTGIGLACGYVV